MRGDFFLMRETFFLRRKILALHRKTFADMRENVCGGIRLILNPSTGRYGAVGGRSPLRPWNNASFG
jgi:hypothetical protein